MNVTGEIRLEARLKAITVTSMSTILRRMYVLKLGLGLGPVLNINYQKLSGQLALNKLGV